MSPYTLGGVVIVAGAVLLGGPFLVDHLQWKLRQSKRGSGWIR